MNLYNNLLMSYVTNLYDPTANIKDSGNNTIKIFKIKLMK